MFGWIEIGLKVDSLIFVLTLDQTLGISRGEINDLFTYHSSVLTWCSTSLVT